MQIPDCSSGGGKGVQAQLTEKTSDVFLYYFSPQLFIYTEGAVYSNGTIVFQRYQRGVQHFLGVQLLMHMETCRTCDFPGKGSGPTVPHPFGSSHGQG